MPNTRPWTVGIVDLLGTFIPGLVWLLLVATLVGIFLDQGMGKVSTPIDLISSASTFFDSKSYIYAAILALLAFVIGIFSKSVAMGWAEYISRGVPNWFSFGPSRCHVPDDYEAF